MEDSIKLKGCLDINVYDANGTWKASQCYNNLVTNLGKGYIASRMTSNVTPIMSHMALGLSSTPPTLADTALGIEVGRVQLDSVTPTLNVIQYLATFPAGIATGTLREAGIFSNSVGGTMMNRANINITKGTTDTIVVSWNLAIQ